jgi:hypothetical protein
VGGPITPGTGLAKLYTKPNDGLAVGTAWQPQPNPVTVENWMFADVIANKPIKLRFSRLDQNQNPIYVVDVEGCKAVTAT